MVKINYADPELRFDHLVIFEQDNTIFAAARYNRNRMRIFLIHEDTGNVYTRNGTVESWEQLFEGEADTIRNRVKDIRGAIPTYKINGSTEPFDSTQGKLTASGSHN